MTILFSLIADELKKNNLDQNSIQYLSNYRWNALLFLDYFLNLVSIFNSNNNLMEMIQYDNVHSIIFEFTLYYSQLNKIQLSFIEKQEIQLLISKLVSLWINNLLFNNLQNKRKFFKN